MCDEYEQKLDRRKALDKKVEELKQQQGEFNLSGGYNNIHTQPIYVPNPDHSRPTQHPAEPRAVLLFSEAPPPNY